jgi:hypothetical protein
MDFGLTCLAIVVKFLSRSRSAVISFPFSEASTEAHYTRFFHSVEAFYYLMNAIKSTISCFGRCPGQEIKDGRE